MGKRSSQRFRLRHFAIASLAIPVFTGCVGRFSWEESLGLLVTDVATGEPVPDAEIEFAAVKEIGDRLPDEILESHGQVVGRTSATGCIEVPIVADHDLVFFATTNVYFDPDWVVRIKSGDESETILIETAGFYSFGGLIEYGMGERFRIDTKPFEPGRR